MRWLKSLTNRCRPAWLCASAMLVLAGRAAASEHPLIDIAFVNVTEARADVSGGLRRGGGVLDKADLTANYNGDDHGDNGLSIFVDLQATGGTQLSRQFVGDALIVSNIEAPPGFRVLDAWAAKDFGKIAIKGGLVDLNSEFDVQDVAALFLNSAHGIGADFSQAGNNGPSVFPNVGLGAIGTWRPADDWQIKAGIFEGTPGDPAHPGETAISIDRDEGALLAVELRNNVSHNFIVGIGGWHYTTDFEAIDDASRRIAGNSGLYAMMEGQLYPQAGSADAGLFAWLRIGLADDRVNPIDGTYSEGLVYKAPFGRKDDQAGIAVAHAHFGDPARRSGAVTGIAETNLEATYSFALNEHLSIQPDFQYVISPSADKAIPNAAVIGLRVTAAW